MRRSEPAFKDYHEATKHSYLSVMMDPNYVDASTQPSPFKFYPKFYRRFPLETDNPLHSFIRLTSTITFNKIYKDGPYQLRVNPSAGALYPTEVYVQIRGVKGMIDGIYHLEVANNALTLIYELIDEGVESYIFPNQIVKGFIFLVSCVYYRSSWKYKNRSLRYCFLDSGHHLGAIEASAYLHDRDIQFIFDFDKLTLNEDLGFENKEFITACAVSGEFKEKSTRRLRQKVPFVCGTDYFEPNKLVEEGYKDTVFQRSYEKKLDYPKFNLEKERFLETVLRRRSARRFKKQPISKDDFLHIWQHIEQQIPTESFEEIEIYSVVNRVEGLETGLYKLSSYPVLNKPQILPFFETPKGAEVYAEVANAFGARCESNGTHLLKAGDFSEKAGYLCIGQALGRDSAVTLFFVSAYRNYQTAVQLAGFLGQRLYLVSDYIGISCSGIGAYYDDETQEFLGTDKDVLYAMALGL